jgi:4-hydroxy-tetrahydrodipicolinate synthase
MFHGSLTALITPFKDGAVDWKALDKLIDFQLGSGTHGLVACGTTGEAPALTSEEHDRIVGRCHAAVKGRDVPVIAGTGSNSTAKTVEMTKHAQASGADAALIVTPYYNKPTQEGLYQHYKAVAEACDIPILIYNIPGRAVVDMSLETLERLAGISNIIGIKDATADLKRVKQMRAITSEEFCLLSGDDATALAFLKEGGHGCISVTSNIAPAACAALQNAWRAGKKDEAQRLDDQLRPLYRDLFCETSPQPVKYAASRLGICGDEMRLPLVPASATARGIVDAAMEQSGLLAVKSRAHG